LTRADTVCNIGTVHPYGIMTRSTRPSSNARTAPAAPLGVLTARQQQILDWIRSQLEATGLPPTRAEIAAGLGFSTPSSAEDHLRALARKGVIELLPGASRGLRLRDLPGVPQQGTLCITTELGKLDVPPGHIALIPRGLRFAVALDGPSRGYVCENYGAPFQLPDLGPIGSNGLANPRDFETPVAWFEDIEGEHEIVQKFQGRLWRTVMDHSPFDVVAWHGNSAPCRYDLARFNTIGTVSFDHPDPSIFTVLTSPSEIPGTANCDFVIFPPRWMVAEDTFRPPWFHRNVMSEFMGLVRGAYDAKEGGGFEPGGASLHNQMNGHGPDAETHRRASDAELKPIKLEDTLAFMFESRWVIRPTRVAMELPGLQSDYDDCWQGFEKAKLPE